MRARALEGRLRRCERASSLLMPSDNGPSLVFVRIDAAGQGRISSVMGPWRGCPSCGWPDDAYEPFCGDVFDLEAYYARCGWAPQRTVFGGPEVQGEQLFFRRQREKARDAATPC